MSCRIQVVASFCAIACATLVNQASADTSYIVYPGLSYLQIGSPDITITPQDTDSDYLTFGGNLVVEYGTGTIEFLDDTELDAIEYGDLAPEIGGSAGTDPADAGVNLSFLEIDGVAALRDIIATLTSAPIDLIDDEFSADEITGGIVTGSMDYNVELVGSGSSDLSDTSQLNDTDGAFGTITYEGLLEIVTVPLYLELPFDIDEATVTVTLTGQIVAYRELGGGSFLATSPVPEPGSLALLAIGMAVLAPLSLRRLRKSSI